MDSKNKKHCLVCNASSDDIPVLSFVFKEKEYNICSQHIPVLIHSPHKLATMLQGAENFPSEKPFEG